MPGPTVPGDLVGVAASARMPEATGNRVHAISAGCSTCSSASAAGSAAPTLAGATDVPHDM